MVNIRFNPLFCKLFTILIFGLKACNICAMDRVADIKQEERTANMFDYKEGEHLRYNGRILVADPDKKFKALFAEGVELNLVKDPKTGIFNQVKIAVADKQVQCDDLLPIVVAKFERDKARQDKVELKVDVQAQLESLLIDSVANSEQGKVWLKDDLQTQLVGPVANNGQKQESGLIGGRSGLEDLEIGDVAKQDVGLEYELKDSLLALVLGTQKGKMLVHIAEFDRDSLVKLCEKYIDSGAQEVKRAVLVLNQSKNKGLLDALEGGLKIGLQDLLKDSSDNNSNTGLQDLTKSSAEVLTNGFLSFLVKNNIEQDKLVKTVSDKAGVLEANVKTEKKKSLITLIIASAITIGMPIATSVISSGSNQGVKYVWDLLFSSGNSTCITK